MKRLTVALSVTLAVATAAASGAKTGSSAATGERVTVTGCLERAPAGDDAQIGTNGSEPGPIFVLLKPAETVSGTAGSAGTSGTDEQRSTVEYRLRTPDVSELVGHEGDKVEIAGTAETPRGSAGRGRTSSRTGSTKAPVLKVVSIKTISSTCSR